MKPCKMFSVTFFWPPEDDYLIATMIWDKNGGEYVFDSIETIDIPGKNKHEEYCNDWDLKQKVFELARLDGIKLKESV